MIIRPQPGPQERFLSSQADIVIYGGAAGGGKTWGLLLEGLRHVSVPGFGAVIFRRNFNQIAAEGGLWDESLRLYIHAGGSPRENDRTWTFPGRQKISFAHLDFEKRKYSWQGAQIAYIGFDELTHFSRAQFLYMLSRNRSMCGVRPYIRATCNPDADSWVAGFVSWWIDDETGLPIPERDGVIRWFVTINDEFLWADSRQELVEKYGADAAPKSVTFIAASVFDNQLLLDANPEYLANLKALPLVERERLLGGNWKIRPQAGLYFKRSYFEIVEAPPAKARRVRWWDLAATEKSEKHRSESNEPDWSAGVLMSRDDSTGLYYIEHVERLQSSPQKVEQAIVRLGASDPSGTTIGYPQDPGQAGKAQSKHLTSKLTGHHTVSFPETGDKVTRAAPLSSQAEAGNIKIVRGPWNDAFLNELENFPDGAKKDQVDAAANAFAVLNGKRPHRQTRLTGF